MWYLVVPPIVVVLSLSFLLWYLSRKGADPVIAEKLLASKRETGGVSFPRTKEFFLRILEKSGQYFKVTSLRLHNTLHEFTQSVKKSRAKVHTALVSPAEPRGGNDSKIIFTDESVAPTPLEPRAPRSVEALLSTPIVRKERVSESAFQVEKKEEIPRPMVSEVAVHPERKKRVHPNVAREESLIGRIARDPKDFTAYEELGDYYLEMENIKDAKECYRQVLKLSPVHRMVKIKIRRLEKLLTKAGE